MIEPGTPAPEFRLRDQTGREISLSDFRGKTVVLYFYPKDNTPGCTIEACAFRDRSAEYVKAGAVVLGVSTDDVASHKSFATAKQLGFSLLADTKHEVAEAYGVWKEKSMFGRKYMGLERATFIIDGAGVVRKVFPRVRVLGHAEKVLEAVAALRA